MYTPQFQEFRFLYKDTAAGHIIQEFMPQMATLMRQNLLPENKVYEDPTDFRKLYFVMHEVCHVVDFMERGIPERSLEQNFGFIPFVKNMKGIQTEIDTCGYQVAWEQFVEKRQPCLRNKADWGVLLQATKFVDVRSRLMAEPISTHTASIMISDFAYRQEKSILDKIKKADVYLFEHVANHLCESFNPNQPRVDR